ncbi:MAG TPA: hypothetical protein DD379_09600 [Cyanobacteria bacterium UBA11162]|nr:hypothetical protein [Cyanobacteria bacterium UBA11162]
MDNFDRLKRESITIAGHYALSDRQDFKRYAERIINCAPNIRFRVQPGEISPGVLLAHIENVRWCRVRQCPLCQYAKVCKWRAKFFQGLTRLSREYPNYRWLFLTLTIKNCSIDTLKVNIRQMSSSWYRLLNHRSLEMIVGYVRSLEITRSDCGEAHPHYHVLLLMPSEYFSEGFLKTEDWVRLWRKSARLDYQPIVHVKAVKSGYSQSFLDGLLETVKYSVKPSDLSIDANWLYLFTDQTHRLKSITVGGLVSQYIHQRSIDQIDSTLVTGDEKRQAGVLGAFCWNCQNELYDLEL